MSHLFSGPRRMSAQYSPKPDSSALSEMGMCRTEHKGGPRPIREILAESPIVRLALSRRLDDPTWPTAQDIADAEWGLSQPSHERQDPLFKDAP